MALSRTLTLTLAGGATLALAAWACVGVYAGAAAEQRLQAWKSAPAAGGALKLQALQHDRGLFASKGRMDLRYQPTCAASAQTDAVVTVRVEYSLSHLAGWSGPLGFEWQLQPTGEAGQVLNALFGGEARLEGQGRVSYGGAVRTTLALPELTLQRRGERLTVAASRGELGWSDQALALAWQTDRIVARGAGSAVEANKLAIDIDLKNRMRGIGHMSFGIDRITTEQGTLEGLRLVGDAVEKGDRIDVSIEPSLRSLAVGGQQAKDLTLQIAARNLHGASVETLNRLFEDTCGMASATAEEDRRMRSALHTLLASGFSVGIGKVAGTVGQGAVDGQLMVELRASAGGTAAPIELGQVLQANGKLLLKGSALTEEQKTMALRMGAAMLTPEGLLAEFSFDQGVLKANGRETPMPMVKAALTGADRQLHAFLTGGRDTALAQAPVAAPEAAQEEDEAVAAAPTVAPAEPAAPVAAPAVAPAAAPAEAPPAAAPATTAPAPAPAPVMAQVSESGCADTTACLGQALRAAAREDVEQVRAVATRLDALPKPDLGNKAVARKLNTEGLEALKRDDFAAAVDAFRRGQRENPRDVELAGNLGFALVKAGKPGDAVTVLTQALVLDPRRSSTWTPLAEALALANRRDEAVAALWVAFQWSGNRDKSLAFYASQADKERGVRPALAEMYAAMLGWTGGSKPQVVATLARR